MNLKRTVVVVAALLVCAVAAPARAQEARTLDISFNGGRVTLVAENVTLREILAEWARKGGSRIVNAERVTGQPVLRTQFENQPEADVLRALLREVPAYGASMRTVSEAGISVVAAVFILATTSEASAPSAIPAPPPAQSFSTSGNTTSNVTPGMVPPQFVQASPDEMAPVRPVMSSGPPATPEPTTKGATNPHLRVGPNGVVTSTVPGVIIPVQEVAPQQGATPVQGVPPAPWVLPGASTPEPRGSAPPLGSGRGRAGGGGR
jgi:hypothetical protein